MEGIRFRLAFATVAVIAVAACGSGAPKPSPSPVPTSPPYSGSGLFPVPTPSAAPASVLPVATSSDAPMVTSAAALDHRHRGSQAPDGTIIFGTDYAADSKGVTLTGERTTFAAGHEIAWRLTLPAATGGENVRVTLTTDSGAETQVDSFVAQNGWDVYYGKAMLSVMPGTYALHYLFDGQDVGSGAFKIKAADGSGVASPT